MNVAEANAFFQLAQSLETDATDEQRQRGAQAAEFLAKRARVCLNAGPAALQVVSLVEDVHTVIADAYEADVPASASRASTPGTGVASSPTTEAGTPSARRTA